MWHCEGGLKWIEFRWGNMRESNHFKDLGVDGSIILQSYEM
jgi:hypothetical protein